MSECSVENVQEKYRGRLQPERLAPIYRKTFEFDRVTTFSVFKAIQLQFLRPFTQNVDSKLNEGYASFQMFDGSCFNFKRTSKYMGTHAIYHL